MVRDLQEKIELVYPWSKMCHSRKSISLEKMETWTSISVQRLLSLGLQLWWHWWYHEMSHCDEGSEDSFTCMDTYWSLCEATRIAKTIDQNLRHQLWKLFYQLLLHSLNGWCLKKRACPSLVETKLWRRRCKRKLPDFDVDNYDFHWTDQVRHHGSHCKYN